MVEFGPLSVKTKMRRKKHSSRAKSRSYAFADEYYGYDDALTAGGFAGSSQSGRKLSELMSVIDIS